MSNFWLLLIRDEKKILDDLQKELNEDITCVNRIFSSEESAKNFIAAFAQKIAAKNGFHTADWDIELQMTVVLDIVDSSGGALKLTKFTAEKLYLHDKIF
jgi:hypothetical protein